MQDRAWKVQDSYVASYAVADIVVRHLPRNVSTLFHYFYTKVVLYFVLLINLGNISVAWAQLNAARPLLCARH